MARLSDSDRAAFARCPPWTGDPRWRSPRTLEPTPEARARYCRWAARAAKFFKGTKPVRFGGKHWKL